MLKNASIQIYDKNLDVGETWLENRSECTIFDSGCYGTDTALAEGIPVVHVTSHRCLTNLHSIEIQDGPNVSPAQLRYGIILAIL